MPEMFDPPHPGSSLASALDALNLSAEQFASNLSVSSKSISQVDVYKRQMLRGYIFSNYW